MLETFELGTTTPSEENCVSVSSTNQYFTAMKKEARVYVNQLRRVFGEEPGGSYMKLINCPHDFGTYVDIAYRFDENNEEHIDYMQKIETGCEYWDAIAKEELKAA